MSRPPYTVPEAMQVLGVSDKTIRRMINAGQLYEAGRDAGNRILISPETVDAAAVQLGRKVTARQEVRELAPAINANAEASLAAITAYRDVVEQQNQRIFELQQELAEYRAAQKYLPQPGQLQELEAQLKQERRCLNTDSGRGKDYRPRYRPIVADRKGLHHAPLYFVDNPAPDRPRDRRYLRLWLSRARIQ